MAEDHTERDKRMHTLTDRGEEMFQIQFEQHTGGMTKAWAIVDNNISNIDVQRNDLSALLSLEQDLRDNMRKFDKLSSETMNFLRRSNTVESLSLLRKHTLSDEGYTWLADKALRKLKTYVSDFDEPTLSSRSRGSRHSSRSSAAGSTLSNALALKKAEAGAAKVRVTFAKEELELKKQQAILNADIEFLIQKKEAAAVEAEVEALQECEELFKVKSHNSSLNIDSHEHGHPHDFVLPHRPLRNVREKVEDYLNDIALTNNPDHLNNVDNFAVSNKNPQPLDPDAHSYVPNSRHDREETVQSECHDSQNPATPVNHTVASDLTRFLLKKDLLLSRLTNFNDRAETYNSWKLTFHAVMTDLGVNPQEEMDLLLKWSGPASQKHVLSIKAANTRSPEKGLSRIWERLDERYGAPEMIQASLRQRLDAFPKLSPKDAKKLYDLSDIVSEIEAIKEDEKYWSLLGHFDSSTGVSPIVSKLPYGLQEKWTTSAVRFTRTHGVIYPPFSHFAEFLREQSRTKNNPSFVYNDSALPPTSPGQRKEKPNRNTVYTRKTDMKDAVESPINTMENSQTKGQRCPLHNADHSLNECRVFRAKSIEDRRCFLREKKLCFRCCDSTSHRKRECEANVRCVECGSNSHPSALHYGKLSSSLTHSICGNGGESVSVISNNPSVNSNCTQICGDNFGGKSCAKILLVRIYPKEDRASAVMTYAMVDDQSNRSLASPKLFDMLGVKGESTEYMLSSCAGKFKVSGRKAKDMMIESLDGTTRLQLPTIIECEQVPDCKDEIPTPEVTSSYHHLHDIKRYIPPLQEDTIVTLLIGRDLISAHHVLDQRIGPANSPYAQKLPLGWTIIGETCLNKVHRPSSVSTYKTHVLPTGRISLFPPCPSNFKVQETLANLETSPINANEHETLGAGIFRKTPEDEKFGMSVEDRKFLKVMDERFSKDSRGNWEAPLPFKEPRPRLPNNRQMAYRRAKALDANLKRDPAKRKHFVTFMDDIFRQGHAELAPPVNDEESWYLPVFGVYHPKKKDQIRGVFDSSAEQEGLSLNKVLLSGPDLTNSLLGILLRFRQAPVAIMADIQRMFYSFYVIKEHRNYLRFFWYTDNDPTQPLTEYRMCVHVFGNSPSPAVATYGLRKTAYEMEGIHGKDVREFVERNFYVDDGLTSVSTAGEATSLMKRTQEALLSGGNLKLHKVASNCQEVINSFPNEDLARGLKDLDLESDRLPTQRSLGLSWNLQSDVFTFQVTQDIKPYTRRGILSTINSLYDPLGFIAPVTIKGRILLRTMVSGTTDWDEPLPENFRDQWVQWERSLQDLNVLSIPRTYSPLPISSVSREEIHIYCDASEKAIAAVAYLRTFHENGSVHTGFVLGKAKVAPAHGHTIPRLELCGAVLGVEIAELVAEHLDMPMLDFGFHTDSRVVLGYIYNESRRFYTYVANRVERIRQTTRPQQWTFVPTEQNPADQGTRSIPSTEMSASKWLLGPPSLSRGAESPQQVTFQVENPELDKEIRPEVVTLKTDTSDSHLLGSHRFERFSRWKNLVEAIARLQHVASTFSRGTNCKTVKTPDAFESAQRFILQQIQGEAYRRDIECIREGKPLPNDSHISSLNPFLDEIGILRVGGRLGNAEMSIRERHPILVPGRCHVATLIVRHYHEITKHQGRHLTEGAVRSAGFWITGGKSIISSVINKCVPCKRLRGNLGFQKMSELPGDRLDPGPPFTNVGVDCFGPWSVVSRRTRGGQARSKRWGVMFTCLTTRAVHIELVEELSSSSFINALRRFIAIRGPVKLFRSDRGTNFIGSTDDLHVDAVNCEDDKMKDFLYNNGSTWIFNPPHASHMGGVWERMIGLTRRILDSLLLDVPGSGLTHEVLVTFLAEVSAIINARPLVPLSSDPEDPYPLSPNMLLTQKPNRIVEIPPLLNSKDMYKAQWKRVQLLAEMFWRRWRSQYLQSLQTRRKWKDHQRNFMSGNVVLMKENQVPRNHWPLGIVTKTFPGTDELVRKVEVRVIREGHRSANFVRPVTELVLLIPERDI